MSLQQKFLHKMSLLQEFLHRMSGETAVHWVVPKIIFPNMDPIKLTFELHVSHSMLELITISKRAH